MLTKKLILWIALLLLFSLSCKAFDLGTSLGNASTDTPAVDLAATESTLKTAIAQVTSGAQGTAEAQATASAATATQPAPPPSPTPGQGAQATEPVSAKPPSKPPVDDKATQQAQGMQAIIQQLFDEGVVSSVDGEYYRLKDFNQATAKLGYFTYWKVDVNSSPQDFVISTNVAWESASDTANWQDSGCGIVFSLDDVKNFHLAWLSLDGFAQLYQVNKGNWKRLSSQKTAKLSIPNGDAKIMVTSYDKKLNFYVNGNRISNAYDGSLNPGELALTVLSGTNKDFGTRCKMTDIDLWIFK